MTYKLTFSWHTCCFSNFNQTWNAA